MNKPRHQHYIPKSYLKNFALEQDGKYFVEAKLKNEAQPKKRLISIRDICVDKNIYTLPSEIDEDKYAIEKYYASEIDELYPAIYRLLVDDSVEEITEEQRRKIILTTMSLFFRTPKFLNLNERRIDTILDHAVRTHTDKEGKVKIQLNGHWLDFHVEQVGEVRNDLHIENKLNFLSQHLKDLHEFVDFKMEAGLSVITIHGDIDLITSDNPVIMHSVLKNRFNVFDPTNIIQLPLDNRHYLIIYPNTEGVLKDRVFRGDRDLYFVLTSNQQVEENSEEWILGKPQTIHAHLRDQPKYFAETPENIARMDVFEEQRNDIMELSAMLDQFGLTHENTLQKIKELLEKPLHQNNFDLQKDYEELRKKGYYN